MTIRAKEERTALEEAETGPSELVMTRDGPQRLTSRA